MKTLTREDKMLLCAAVGTASHQLLLKVCMVCGSSGNMLKSDKDELNQFAQNQLVKKCYKVFK
jgi:hypothetical protein